MATNNAANIKNAGVVTYDGTGAFTGNAITNGAVLLGSTSNAVTDTGVLSKGTLIVGDGTTAPTLLSVGSNLQVLTADSVEGSGVKWAASSVAASYYELIATGTASASASLVFTDLDASTYINYFFVLDSLRPATDAVNFYVNLSSNNGSSWIGGEYSWNYFYRNTVDGDDNSGVVGDADISVVTNAGNGANETTSGTMYLIDPSSRTTLKITGNLYSTSAAGVPTAYVMGGRLTSSATAIDAIRFIFSSGNITSGTIKMYGISAS